ncbi:MAG TPA: DUF4037 domain-containing protein [Aggregatilineales bacterium]|nr:DUF4037 domain-containing protein [Aggregatilineales bacterium]
MADFIPGLLLAEHFYWDAIRPVLEATFPGLPHSAALIGSGSEVLGFDTPTSTDHHWGPRGLIFLREDDHERYASAVDQALRLHLPRQFYGWSTHFSPPNPDDHGVQLLVESDSGPINHRVELHTLRGFVQQELGFDLDNDLDALDWLTFPSQRLLAITAGAVFHDAIGLEDVRARFRWYPRDVWLYLLAAGWKRLAQEEHLMGRAGQAGDEPGSQIIAARLVRDIMRLALLMERRYPPYAKWFGSAFARTHAAAALNPLLWRALRADEWPERDRALAEAYEILAALHNRLDLTEPLEARAVPFFGRPFNVVFGERFAQALLAQIGDPWLRDMPAIIGSLDQWSDSTDLLEAVRLRQRIKALYRMTDA